MPRAGRIVLPAELSLPPPKEGGVGDLIKYLKKRRRAEPRRCLVKVSLRSLCDLAGAEAQARRHGGTQAHKSRTSGGDRPRGDRPAGQSRTQQRQASRPHRHAGTGGELDTAVYQANPPRETFTTPS